MEVHVRCYNFQHSLFVRKVLMPLRDGSIFAIKAANLSALAAPSDLKDIPADSLGPIYKDFPLIILLEAS
jgi:hypothetical protein